MQYRSGVRPVMAQGHKRVTLKATGCRFDCHSGKENVLHTPFTFLAPALNTQCLLDSKEMGKRKCFNGNGVI